MAPRKSKNTDEVWAQGFLDALKRQDDEAVPSEFKTVLQWSQLWKMSRSHAQKFLSDGLETGLVEMRRFRIFNRMKVYPVPHYRLKKPVVTKKVTAGRAA